MFKYGGPSLGAAERHPIVQTFRAPIMYTHTVHTELCTAATHTGTKDRSSRRAVRPPQPQNPLSLESSRSHFTNVNHDINTQSKINRINFVHLFLLWSMLSHLSRPFCVTCFQSQLAHVTRGARCRFWKNKVEIFSNASYTHSQWNKYKKLWITHSLRTRKIVDRRLSVCYWQRRASASSLWTRQAAMSVVPRSPLLLVVKAVLVSLFIRPHHGAGGPSDPPALRSAFFRILWWVQE